MREDGSMMSPGAYANPCTKCSGRGSLPHYERWSGGICYGCSGTGEEPKGGHRTRRPPPARTARKLPHPSPTEARALASKQLEIARAEIEEAGQTWMWLTSIDQVEDARGYKQENERVGAFYFGAGMAIGRSIVDYQLFLRAVERGRLRVVAPEYRAAFEKGLEAGIKEQADKYEGIVWEGR